MYKDSAQIREAEETLRLAAEYARKDTDPLAAPLAEVFAQWKKISGFSDCINRVGGPETVRLAKVYLQRVWNVDTPDMPNKE